MEAVIIHDYGNLGSEGQLPPRRLRHLGNDFVVMAMNHVHDHCECSGVPVGGGDTVVTVDLSSL